MYQKLWKARSLLPQEKSFLIPEGLNYRFLSWNQVDYTHKDIQRYLYILHILSNTHAYIYIYMCIYIYIHSWTTPSRPLDGRGVLLTLGGVGVGHVLTFMWTCRWSICYALAAGRCRYSWVGWVGWGGAFMNVHVNLQMKYMLCCGCRQVHVFIGGVGWGGACIDVHVNLQMKDMLRCGCRQVHVFMGGVGWGGIITSMSLSFIL